MCDNIVVMYGGRICERGTAREIFYNPKHEYTKGLLRSIPNVNNMKKKLIPISGTPINMLNMPEGCAFCARCDEAMKICLKEIPEELLDLGSEGFYSIVGKTLRAGVVLDRHDFETAEKLYEETAADSTIKLYQIESRCEVLFCKIMNGAPAGEIDELYDKELRTYINTYSKMMISKRRQMYAYQLLYKKDAEAAEKEYRAAMKMKETYPIEGELRSELELIEAVKERAERDNI
jgi:oligopeptide/dipeptide ABC transporter ATP-binding protein